MRQIWCAFKLGEEVIPWQGKGCGIPASTHSMLLHVNLPIVGTLATVLLLQSVADHRCQARACAYHLEDCDLLRTELSRRVENCHIIRKRSRRQAESLLAIHHAFVALATQWQAALGTADVSARSPTAFGVLAFSIFRAAQHFSDALWSMVQSSNSSMCCLRSGPPSSQLPYFCRYVSRPNKDSVFCCDISRKLQA